jgi:hypothetical protein
MSPRIVQMMCPKVLKKGAMCYDRRVPHIIISYFHVYTALRGSGILECKV